MGDIREKARYLRKNQTNAEKVLWRKIRYKQIEGYQFRRQVVIGFCIVDFVCLEKKLVIELDGSPHLENIEYDKQRTEWLNSQGFRVIRFWDSEVINSIDSVKKAILENLLLPSPPVGEGSPVLRGRVGGKGNL